MKLSTRIVLPVVLSFAAAGAIASEFTPEAPFVSTLSRAAVQADAIAASGAGLIARGEFTPVMVADGTSTVTRNQVRAEAIAAERLGVIARGEVTVLPTAQQLEQVRLAGQRANQGDNLAQGQSMPVRN
jgi:hypothetical protein